MILIKLNPPKYTPIQLRPLMEMLDYMEDKPIITGACFYRFIDVDTCLICGQNNRSSGRLTCDSNGCTMAWKQLFYSANWSRAARETNQFIQEEEYTTREYIDYLRDMIFYYYDINNTLDGITWS